MRDFHGRILLIGFGIVAQTLLKMLPRHRRVPLNRITVIDFADCASRLRPWTAKGVRYVRERVTAINLARLLSTHVEAGGIIVDLAWSIDCFDIMEWARKNGVLYVNTSLESWDSTGASTQRTTFEKSLYVRYNKVLAAMAAAPRHAPTAVLDHGANPGLISHFVKRGLLDIGQHILKKNRMTRGSARRLQRLMEDGEFAELARAVGESMQDALGAMARQFSEALEQEAKRTDKTQQGLVTLQETLRSSIEDTICVLRP